MEIIPWPGLASFQQTVVLAGQTYVLWARWNQTYEFWTIDILTGSREPILTGIKIVAGGELISRARDSRLPPGAILVVAVAGTVERIGRDDLGTNFQLVYMTAEDLAA